MKIKTPIKEPIYEKIKSQETKRRDFSEQCQRIRIMIEMEIFILKKYMLTDDERAKLIREAEVTLKMERTGKVQL